MTSKIIVAIVAAVLSLAAPAAAQSTLTLELGYGGAAHLVLHGGEEPEGLRVLYPAAYFNVGFEDPDFPRQVDNEPLCGFGFNGTRRQLLWPDWRYNHPPPPGTVLTFVVYAGDGSACEGPPLATGTFTYNPLVLEPEPEPEPPARSYTLEYEYQGGDTFLMLRGPAPVRPDRQGEVADWWELNRDGETTRLGLGGLTCEIVTTRRALAWEDNHPPVGTSVSFTAYAAAEESHGIRTCEGPPLATVTFTYNPPVPEPPDPPEVPGPTGERFNSCTGFEWTGAVSRLLDARLGYRFINRCDVGIAVSYMNSRPHSVGTASVPRFEAVHHSSSSWDPPSGEVVRLEPGERSEEYAVIGNHQHGGPAEWPGYVPFVAFCSERSTREECRNVPPPDDSHCRAVYGGAVTCGALPGGGREPDVPEPYSAPDQPAGVVAAAEAGRVTLSWPNPGDPSIATYEYALRQAGGRIGEWTTVPGSNADTTSVMIDLEAGTAVAVNNATPPMVEWIVYLRARNVDGHAGRYVEVVVSGAAGPAEPEAPEPGPETVVPALPLAGLASLFVVLFLGGLLRLRRRG